MEGFELMLSLVECRRRTAGRPPARILVRPVPVGQWIVQCHGARGACVDAASGQVEAEGSHRIQPGLAIGDVKCRHAGAPAKQTRGMQDSQRRAPVACTERLAGEPFGGFGLDRARGSIVQQATPGVGGARVKAGRERPRQRGQVSLDLPFARQTVARGRAKAVEVRLEQTRRPQLVERCVKITHE